MRAKVAWKPLPRQELAYYSKADELFYGGAAGGGKSDLLLGLSLYEHQRAIIFRREFVQLTGMIDRSSEIYSGLAKFNRTTKRWSGFDDPFKIVEFGACQLPGDIEKYQGRAHDFKGFDEITQFTESMYRFLINWCRTSDPNQRSRCMVAGNPPITAEGEWVIRYWAPWLDEEYRGTHAEPGELRWFTTSEDGTDLEVPNGDKILIKGEWVMPKSRTFIPARIEDNPYLIASGYKGTLQSLPEPLRSKMLNGDFAAGGQDDEYQVIPTAWVLRAQARWRDLKRPSVPMTHVGLDVARGGGDRTVITYRYAEFVLEQKVIKGSDTPDSNSIVGMINASTPKGVVVMLDVIGVGAAAYDSLKNVGVNAVPLNSSKRSTRKDRHGQLTFANKRAEWWWGLRDSLDPESGDNIAIPDDSELRRELCTPRWKQTVRGVQIEGKDAIKARIQKSTDKADSLVYAFANEGTTAIGYINVDFMGR